MSPLYKEPKNFSTSGRQTALTPKFPMPPTLVRSNHFTTGGIPRQAAIPLRIPFRSFSQIFERRLRRSGPVVFKHRMPKKFVPIRAMVPAPPVPNKLVLLQFLQVIFYLTHAFSDILVEADEGRPTILVLTSPPGRDVVQALGAVAQVPKPDFAQFRISSADYIKRLFIGHYSPAGNNFYATAIRKPVVDWLEPKPVAYRGGASVIDFQDGRYLDRAPGSPRKK